MIKLARFLTTMAIIVLALIPVIALADAEYVPGGNGTIYAQVLNGDGSPADAANVSLTLWSFNGSKILDSVNMVHVTGSSGIYAYNFTSPAIEGFYLAEINSTNPVAYGSEQIHVSAQAGANTSAIWSANVSGYTGSSVGAFINSIYQFFGGDNMLNSVGVPQIIFVSVLMGFAFWKKGWLRAILSLCLIIWGIFALPYDIKIAAPLIGIGTVLFITAIMNLVGRMREERE